MVEDYKISIDVPVWVECRKNKRSDMYSRIRRYLVYMQNGMVYDISTPRGLRKEEESFWKRESRWEQRLFSRLKRWEKRHPIGGIILGTILGGILISLIAGCILEGALMAIGV